MSERSGNSFGVGFGGLLTILFIGLKLTHVIDWTWIWVLSPLWIPFAFVLALIAICFFGVFMAEVFKQVSDRISK